MAAAIIASIQTGSVSFDNAGTTSTVTWVDTSKSVLFFSTSWPNYNLLRSVSGELTGSTTITWEADTQSNTTRTVEWTLVEFSAGVSVQRGSLDVNIATSATITAVDLSKSFIVPGGLLFGDNNSNRSECTAWNLTSTTTIEVETSNPTDADHGAGQYQVVEFDEGISVQRGSTYVDEVTSETQSITAVSDTAKCVVSLAVSTPITGIGSRAGPRTVHFTSAFNSTSEIEFERGSDIGSVTVFWEVIEFTGSEFGVQKVAPAFGATDTQVDTTITAVDLSESFIWPSFHGLHGGGGGRFPDPANSFDDFGAAQARFELTSTTNARATRGATLSGGSGGSNVALFSDAYVLSAPGGGSGGGPAIGDIGHWRDSVGSQIPGTSFAGFNFASEERLDNESYSKPGGVTLNRVTMDGKDEVSKVTIDLPSAATDGRLLLAAIGPDDTHTFTDLDGFTSRLAQTVGPASDYLLVASKEASSEGTQYEFTRGGSNEGWAGGLLEFSGANNSDPILTESSVGTGTCSATGPVAAICPALTAQSSDSKIVRIFMFNALGAAEWASIDGGTSSSVDQDADEEGRLRNGQEGVVLYVSDSPGAGVTTGTESLFMTYQSTPYAAVTLEIGPETSPDSTVRFTAAGDYLLTWHLKGSDTSNGRHAPQSRAAVTVGSGAFFTTYYSGFNRNSNNSTFGTDGFAFYRAAANDQVQIQWKRDTDTPTGGTDINESDLQIVRLGDSYNYGIYNSTDDNQAYGGTTPTDINFQTTILESNTAQIEKVSDTDIRLKGDAAKRYLICYGVSGDTAGSRTQRVSRVMAGTSEIEASRSYFYSRNSTNEFVGLGAPFLWKKAGTTDDISVQMWRGDGVLADEGGADVDGTFDSINGEQTALFVCELPDYVDVFSSYDSVGGQDIAGGVTTSINAVRDVAFNDSASFTKASDTEINVVQASDVLVFGNIWTARADVSSGTRLTLGARFTIDGVDQTTGTSITYTRGNQGSQDTFAGSWHPSAMYSISAGADLLLETFDDGQNGGDDTTQPNTVGLFTINLDTLEEPASSTTAYSVTSGEISLYGLQVFLSDTGSISMSDLYKGGSLISNEAVNVSVPTSGQIALSDLYGVHKDN